MLIGFCIIAAVAFVALPLKSYYMFVMVARRGYRLSYFRYPWEALKGWLRVPTIPTDERVFFTVIRVTPSGVEHHLASVADSTGKIPDFFTPVGETIYANCQGTLCKWTGDHFEVATTEEQTMMDGINHLGPDVDTKINGWPKKGIGPVLGESQFSIQLDKDLALLVRQGNINKLVNESAAVDLQRTGQTPEPLWHVDGKPRKVTKKEYERALSPTTTEMTGIIP